MPLETASFINGLNSSYPNSADGAEQGDDHIRLIKAAIKATFPNIDGAITLTDEQINLLVGRLEAIELFGTPVIRTDGTTLTLDATSTQAEARDVLGVGPTQGPTFGSVKMGTWEIISSGSYLQFKSGGIVVFRINTSGKIEAADNVGAFVTGM